VFGVGEDPVKLGLVASLARPGGNATGNNYSSGELVAKRLALLHDLVPKAVRVAALLNPANQAGAESLRDVQNAAHVIGLQIHVLNASTNREIDAAFATLARERPDALIVAPDSFFLFSGRVQIATLAARNGIAAAYSTRDYDGCIGIGCMRIKTAINVAKAPPGRHWAGPSLIPARIPQRPTTLGVQVHQPSHAQGH
jgi:putative ABC transport system substrate-binding protein